MPTALTHIGHGFNPHPGQSFVCGIVPAVMSRPGFYLPLVSINLLRSLHWLRVPERISFRLAVLVYRCLHGSAPGYLASDLQHVSDIGARRRLRSSRTSALVGPRTLRATIGDCAFPAAAASVWNSLSESVRALPSLPVFRGRLKTELFSRSYSCSD